MVKKLKFKKNGKEFKNDMIKNTVSSGNVSVHTVTHIPAAAPPIFHRRRRCHRRQQRSCPGAPSLILHNPAPSPPLASPPHSSQPRLPHLPPARPRPLSPNLPPRPIPPPLPLSRAATHPRALRQTLTRPPLLRPRVPPHAPPQSAAGALPCHPHPRLRPRRKTPLRRPPLPQTPTPPRPTLREIPQRASERAGSEQTVPFSALGV